MPEWSECEGEVAARREVVVERARVAEAADVVLMLVVRGARREVRMRVVGRRGIVTANVWCLY